jgi:hypothetical protein
MVEYNEAYPQFEPGTVYPEFKLDRKCAKCKLGGEEGEFPAKASYNQHFNHIRRQCSYCGYFWWEAPKGG